MARNKRERNADDISREALKDGFAQWLEEYRAKQETRSRVAEQSRKQYAIRKSFAS